MNKSRSKPSPKQKKNKSSRKEAVVLNQTLPGFAYDELTRQIISAVGLVRSGIKRGEIGAIQTAVMASEFFAKEIERAYKMHPSLLKKQTEGLDVLCVLISPKAVASDEHQERKQVRAFLKNCGVGTKSVRPTGKKTQTDSLWSVLAQDALREITIAISAKSQLSHPFFKELLDREKAKRGLLIDQVADLPPFSKKSLPRWWKVARGIIEDYWQKNPRELQIAQSKVEADKGRAKSENGKAFAIRKIRKAFAALVPGQG